MGSCILVSFNIFSHPYPHPIFGVLILLSSLYINLLHRPFTLLVIFISSRPPTPPTALSQFLSQSLHVPPHSLILQLNDTSLRFQSQSGFLLCHKLYIVWFIYCYLYLYYCFMVLFYRLYSVDAGCIFILYFVATSLVNDEALSSTIYTYTYIYTYTHTHTHTYLHTYIFPPLSSILQFFTS